MTGPAWLSWPASRAAPLLLGWRLVSRADGSTTVVRLTEVEAYERDDPASHSYPGPTERNRAMFCRPGTLYVYRSYGVHWCANVVTSPGSAVLLRAGDVVEGRAEMIRRRGRDVHLADGPGKLAQALAIEGRHDGVDLFGGGEVGLEPGGPPAAVTATTRVGITKATGRPWRFLAGGWAAPSR